MLQLEPTQLRDSTAARCNALLTKHTPREAADRHGERLRLLSRAVLAGWITYPNGRTPSDCRRDGLALEAAMESGDRLTLQRLGIRKPTGPLGAKR